MKFKQGQTVYYFVKFPACVILSGIVTGAKRDLVTREIIYTIRKDYNYPTDMFRGFCEDSHVDLKEKELYANKEKLEKLHRDEIVYDKLSKELLEVKRILEEIKLKVDSNTITLDFNDLKYTATVTKGDIVISDFGSITDKIKKLEKEVSSIKKKIKISKK